MKKQSLMWVALISLLLINAVTLTVVLVRRPPPLRPPRETWLFVSNTLDLNPAQRRQYSAMRYQHRALMEDFRNRYESTLRQYMELLSADTSVVERKTYLEARLAEIDAARVQITFNHFKELKGICTPAQQSRFPLLISELTHMLTGPPPPPPRK